jgi:nitroreductase
MSVLSSSTSRTWVSPIVAVTFVIVSVTGILMLLHVQTSGMNNLHEWIGVLFVAAGLFHLVLNWKVFLPYLKKRIGVAAAVFALLLGVALYVFPIHLFGDATGKGQKSSSAPPIVLPSPQITAGMPLMQALAHRHTARVFQDKPLPQQTLSNLLWAAFGVNRPRGEKQKLGRTAPSAMNRQEIELYVVLSQGVYVYDAEANRLQPVLDGDFRAKIGKGEAAHAAATLLFVVSDAKNEFAQVDTGFIGQNVYLFAASEGLNAWFYTLHSHEVSETLKLPAGKTPLYAQSVGYPPQ